MCRRWCRLVRSVVLFCKFRFLLWIRQLSHPNSAFLVCDRIGRIWATRQLCLLWILGIGIFLGANGSLAAIYAGRFIAGLGVGQTVVVGPVYLAEIVSIPSHTVPMQADRRG